MIFALCRRVLDEAWEGEKVHQVQVTALDPRPASQQLELFAPAGGRRRLLHAAIDRVNDRFGALTLAPARLLGRSDMPDVIAPAWKPSGHRRTV